MKHNGYEYVDLGLPSGLKWATCNVGASTPTEYGDYFMWGSTTPNTNDVCSWANAPFNNGCYDFDITYFNSVRDTVCPNGILAPEYDAAHIIMGGEWRMPTNEEYKELIENTNHELVEDYQGIGINGILFTSKVDSSKSIFIPASGYRYGSSVYKQGSRAYLWSSSLYESIAECALGLYFYSVYCCMCGNSRYYGMCLRGVL